MQADANRTPDRIDALPGLGPKSRDMLAAAGITTSDLFDPAVRDAIATPGELHALLEGCAGPVLLIA